MVGELRALPPLVLAAAAAIAAAVATATATAVATAVAVAVATATATAVALLVLVALAGLSPCCSCAAPSAFWLFAASGKGDSGNKRHVNNKDPPTTKLEKTNVCCSETAKFSGAHRTWAQGRKQTNSSRAAPLFLG